VSRLVKRSHTAIIRDWIQKYKPEMLSSRKIHTTEFIIEETIIKVGSEYIWLWIAIEATREILQISISKERNMYVVVERFILNLVKRYRKHPVSTDGGTWYPQAFRFLKLSHHHIHSSHEQSIIERTVQYIKDRTKGFDDYSPCRKSKCGLQHIQKWLNLFVSHYNSNLLT